VSRRAVAVCCLALLAAGCAPGGGGATPARTAAYASAPCPNPIYPGVPQLDLGPGVECGYLTVPQSRADPTGPTIRLAVARAKATSPNPAPDPLVYLAGGPGGSGLLSAAPRIAAGWNADRDVIFLDQRGTWKSDPLLACPEIDAFLAEWISLNSLDPATAEKSGAATRACRDRIAAEGRNPADYDTTENAADVADLRVALGVDKWNLYGVSYGTDLALQTLRDHPDGIRSVVLDSVVPPQENVLEHFWPSAAHGYRQLFDDCATVPACATAHPTFEADFTALVNDLATNPRTVPVADPATGREVPVVIDGYKVANLVVVSSLSPGDIAPLPTIIDNLAHGDGSLAAQRLAAGAPPPGVTSYGLALGVFCSEHAAFTSRERMVDAARAVLPGFPDAVLALAPQAPYILGDCAQWNIPAAAPAVAAPVVSDVPVLVLSGALDAITAPPNGDVVAGGLRNATTLVFPDAAHDVTLWSPTCGVAVMRSFLADPARVDQSCISGLPTAPTFT
jgi:pimeloyl-ACP methyl ester carboxylesterase